MVNDSVINLNNKSYNNNNGKTKTQIMSWYAHSSFARVTAIDHTNTHNIRKARAGIKTQWTKEEWIKVKAKARLIGGYSDCVQALKSKSKLKHNGAEELKADMSDW